MAKKTKVFPAISGEVQDINFDNSHVPKPGNGERSPVTRMRYYGGSNHYLDNIEHQSSSLGHLSLRRSKHKFR